MDYSKLAASIIMPRLQVDKYVGFDDYKFYIKRLIDQGINSFCLFGRVNLEDVRKTINELNNYAEKDLFYSADLEFGLKMRFNEGTGFPHAMSLGKTADYKLTFLVAQLIAQEAKNLGINWNFAPVCDINSNPKNPIINIRAFGEDAETVGIHAAAYIKGMNEIGVLSCAKHFPGHGDTDIDSHLDLPIINKSKVEIYNNEILPFIKAIENGVDSIMIGHLSIPSLNTMHYPASLSKSVNDILRKDLKFDGIILPDALDMNSVSNSFDSTMASELALQAGNDILLLPEEVEMAIEGVANLIKKDANLLKQVESSIDRINSKFEWAKNKKLPDNIEFNQDYYLKNEKFSLQVARKAIDLTVKEILTPLDNEKQLAGFAFLQKDEDIIQASTFFNFIQQALQSDFDFAYINENIEEKDLLGLKEGIVDADILIFAYFYKSHAYQGDIGFTEKLYSITQRLAMGKPIINIFFGNPYLSDNLPAELTIKTFSDSLSSLASATMVLTGKELINDDNINMN
jgi:beta-glucosidase-like glycosyl hydrolase